ncbi:MAG TPA: hypothetical protein HA272_02270 [Methanoregula sp.]|nr:hypothetical protein [Methanoregula sp.]
MEKISWRVLAFAGLLLFAVFVAGCSDEAAKPPADVAPLVTTSSGPLYSAGDLVKNPQSTAGTAVLIIRYDAASDKYERAYVYPNSDGSLGYRLDSKTDLIEREMIERTYTEKIRTVAVSSIPIGNTATVTTTAAPGATTVTTKATTSTVTTTKGYAPKITGIEPDKGKTGTTVSITDLTGQNFVSAANVSLKKGSSLIHATDVVVTSTLITGKFAIPSDAALGYWSLVVTNPDKQSDTFQNAFLVQQGTATTTTTSSSSSDPSAIVTITSIQTPLIVTGGADNYGTTVEVLGTNLTAGNKMKLIRSGSTLVSTWYNCPTTTRAQGLFSIPAGTVGTYNVAIYSSSDTELARSSNTLEIRNT